MRHKKTLTPFLLWIIGIVSFSILLIVLYLILKVLGYISMYEQAVPNENSVADAVTLSIIALIAVAYVILSLFNLLSHKADEDCRMHCLPIVMSLIFLIIEHGFLHLYVGIVGDYYTNMVSIFSATSLGIVTFASLKFSFGISVQHKRVSEILQYKPDITVVSNHDGEYIATVKNNDCFMCGIYVGTITKKKYDDAKKFYNEFDMFNLYFRDDVIQCDKGIHKVDIDYFAKAVILESVPLESRIDKLYFIFRDQRNYFYFVKLSLNSRLNSYFVVPESTIDLLIHKGKNQSEKINKTNNNSGKHKTKKNDRAIKPIKIFDCLNMSCSYIRALPN